MIRASDIAAFVGAELLGNNIAIQKVASLGTPTPQSIVFSDGPTGVLPAGLGALLLLPMTGTIELNSGNGYIQVANPRLSFARVVEEFFIDAWKPGVSQRAHVDGSARIGVGCRIEAGAVVEAGVVIGDKCLVEYNAILRKGCKIGSGVVIGANSVLGSDGLSTANDEKGNIVRIRHVGGLRIGNNVEIGANSTVQKGTIDDTIIADNVKTSPNVNIGHNTYIGNNTMIASGACVCGSSHVGSMCYIGAGAVIREFVRVGDSATIGMQAVVRRSVSSKTKILGLESLPIERLAKFCVSQNYK